MTRTPAKSTIAIFVVWSLWAIACFYVDDLWTLLLGYGLGVAMQMCVQRWQDAKGEQ